MKILIETTPHLKQRYNTVGDWYVEGDIVCIRVSQLGNWRYEALIAVHELFEYLLCTHDGITQETVDQFDKTYLGDEPGDDPFAPYRSQHCFATGIERMLAAALDVGWKQYEDVLDRVSIGGPPS